MVVIGEVLIELSSTEPFRHGGSLRLGFSGDALNAAAAAAATGARVGLVTRVATDELGDLIVARIAELGIDTGLVHRVAGHNGAYFVRADPDGKREFVYIRRGSAASQLSPDDIDVADAAVVLATGVTCALSDSATAAVSAAAEQAQRFVYDPNFRPRLTDAATAAARLRELAPHADLLTPSLDEATVLLGLTDPAEIAEACRKMGARAVAITCGASGVWLDDGASAALLPAVPPPAIVDQTGAGDAFTGTVAAWLALGDALPAAVRQGMAAASAVLGVQGGCAR